ncbi:transcription factor stalky-like [Chironomus tepperi]|uniref:transcription factor stalky-like n=1 Tax=Chironomus tepperi TaxID=113505 RepID=UPI00391F64C5
MHRSIEEISSDSNNRRNSLLIPRPSMNSSPRSSINSSNNSGKFSSNEMHNENFILRRSASVDILEAHTAYSKSKLTNKNYENSFDESINHDDNVPEKTSFNHHYERHQAYFLHKSRKRDPTATQSSSSSSSNQSNYSVNSLLLSVKNLENFNKSNGAIQKSHHRNKAASVHGFIDHNPNIILKSNYYFNYFLNQEANQFPMYEHRWKMLQNIANIPSKHDEKNFTSFNSNQKKEIEADQLSTASSKTTTNFTVISLNDSDERLNKSKKAICRRSHTISILIFVMTTIFVIFISVMLLLMDMRNQKMPS